MSQNLICAWCNNTNVQGYKVYTVKTEKGSSKEVPLCSSCNLERLRRTAD